jgi:hypothetical protein
MVYGIKGGFKLDKLTYRKDKITLVAGVENKITFKSTAPNHFIINSSIADVLYVSDTPKPSINQFSKRLTGISRQGYAEVNGLNTIYFMSATSGDIVVESFYADFDQNSLYPNVETLNANNPGTPKALQVTLVAGVPQVVKASPGWICAFGSHMNPATEIRNGVTAVWLGDYISGIPFYNDTSIVLFSSINNVVGIVYL